MINLSKTVTALLVLLLIAQAASASQSVAGVPQCSAEPPYLYDIPIYLRESQTYDMGDIFKGYNLSYHIPQIPTWAQLYDKVTKQNEKLVNLSGLININFQHQGSNWGRKLVTLRAVGNKTFANWGTSVGPNNMALPDLGKQILVEDDSTINCFDAVWSHTDSILVDCVRKTAKGLFNIYFFVDANTRKTISNAENRLYVNFTQITQRKLFYYGERSILFRVYYSWAVDSLHSSRTYVEVISLTDPLNPQTIKILDKKYAGRTKLEVLDCSLIFDQFLILSSENQLIQSKIDQLLSQVTPTFKLKEVGWLQPLIRFGKQKKYSDSSPSYVVSTLDTINALFFQVQSVYFTVDQNQNVKDVWVTSDFVIAHLETIVGNNKTQSIIFLRRKRFEEEVFFELPLRSNVNFIEINAQFGRIAVIDEIGMTTYCFNPPMLFVEPYDQRINTETTMNVIAVSKSYDTHKICNFTIIFVIIREDQYIGDIFPTGRKFKSDIYVNSSRPFFTPLLGVIGANLTFGAILKQDDPVNYRIWKQNNLELNWPFSDPLPVTQPTIYNAYATPWSGQIIREYIQYHNKTYIRICPFQKYQEKTQCEAESFTELDQPILHLKMLGVQIMAQYIGVVYAAKPNELIFYRTPFSYVSPQHVKKGFLVINNLGNNTYIRSFEGDIIYLVVLAQNELKNQIRVYYFDTCVYSVEYQCQQIYTINQQALQNMGVRGFQPQSIHLDRNQPDRKVTKLYVKCKSRILIFELTPSKYLFLTDLVNDDTQFQPNWKMASTQHSLVIANNKGLTLHTFISMTDGVFFSNKIPLYNYTISDDFDLKASSTFVYLTVVTPHNTSAILTYRTGVPSSVSLESVRDLGRKAQGLRIFNHEFPGGYISDLVTVIEAGYLTTFQQFIEPQLMVQEVPLGDHSFNLTVTNDPNNRWFYLFRISVHSSKKLTGLSSLLEENKIPQLRAEEA